jgi:hypothetical protein
MKMVCFWPGLPSAWHLGDLRGLVVSVVFGWALTLALASTFIWPLWIQPLVRGALWAGIVGYWVVESVRANWSFGDRIAHQSVGLSKEFLNAQQAYLEGNWFDAEALLLEIIDRKPRDAEALLMLVGVLRHTHRWQAALRRLSQLEYLESASVWRYEISREKQLIQAAMSDAEDLPSEEAAEAAEMEQNETDAPKLAVGPESDFAEQ